MHGKEANKKFTAMRTKLQADSSAYPDYDELMKWIDHGLQLHKQYGGRIFAIGMVTGIPVYDEPVDDLLHWSTRLYAEISQVFVLPCPVHISEFNSFIRVSRVGATTGVFGKEYGKLKELIGRKNPLPDYFQ